MKAVQLPSDSGTGNKPTINDIARHAGVSLATVDRVLNARPGVREVTIQRVTKAIDELGYIRDTAAANLARRRVYRFVFMLPDSNSEFIAELETQIDTQAILLTNERTHLQKSRLPAYDSQSIALALDELQPDVINGIAVIAPETPTVRDAIARATERGIAVVALLSDLPSSPRDHFIGIDNTSAGQTAAQLMGRFIKAERGDILVLTGSRLARDHIERRHGFDTVMADQFPGLKVLPSVEVRDDQALHEQALANAFANPPTIRGIYSTTANNNALAHFLQKQFSSTAGCSVKLISPIEQVQLQEKTVDPTAKPTVEETYTPDQQAHGTEKPVVIAHELTPRSRDALHRGTFDALISQDTGHIVRSAVRLMRATVDTVPHNALQERIRIEIFLKENLPRDSDPIDVSELP